MILKTNHNEKAIRTRHTSVMKHEEVKPLDLGGETFHWCWMHKSPLWGGSHLFPTHSCVREGWEDVGSGGGGDAGGIHVLQSAVEEEAEEEVVVAEEEGEAEDGGVAWVEGKMGVLTFEMAEGSWRETGGAVVYVGDVREACAPCVSKWMERMEAS